MGKLFSTSLRKAQELQLENGFVVYIGGWLGEFRGSSWVLFFILSTTRSKYTPYTILTYYKLAYIYTNNKYK